MTIQCGGRLSDIELIRLRNIAFEYLPDVKEKMKANEIYLKKHEAYYSQLYTSATLEVKRNIDEFQLASIRLLQAISSHALYDENDPDQQEEGTTPREMLGFTIDDISKAIKTLSQLTGQTIALYLDKSDCAQSSNMLNANVEPEKITKLGLTATNRLQALNHYMETLEQTAKAKGIDFDKQNLPCSKEMMLEWLQSKSHKPHNLFNIEQSTFNTFWKKVAKGYKLTPPAGVKKDFFKKIQE
ncbi:MAG: hypothetical protein V3U87_15210 [Methylococcaceae bacterium]